MIHREGVCVCRSSVCCSFVSADSRAETSTEITSEHLEAHLPSEDEPLQKPFGSESATFPENQEPFQRQPPPYSEDPCRNGALRPLSDVSVQTAKKLPNMHTCGLWEETHLNLRDLNLSNVFKVLASFTGSVIYSNAHGVERPQCCCTRTIAGYFYSIQPHFYLYLFSDAEL